MTDAWAEQLVPLPGRLADHLAITVLPLAIGLAISLPLAILAVTSKRLRYPTLAAVSIVQTIPGLALLALMVPILAGIGAVSAPLLGVEVPSLGFVPTVIALTLYSMLPMLRNTVTGILDVDPAMAEAARGVGMTRMQSLTRVELPLALPVIIAGVRTATVWTVGMATLATPVGQECLGNYIFAGLQTRNWTSVLVGCLGAAGLAILLDSLMGMLQRAVDTRRRGLAIGTLAALALLLVAGLTGPRLIETRRSALVTAESPDPAAAGAAVDEVPLGEVVVGAKTFTESYILAAAIEQTLGKSGIATRRVEGLGSSVVFEALSSGEIDCYVEYSGTIWAHLMKRGEAAPRWRIRDEVDGWLAREHGVRNLGSLGFENAYAIAVTRGSAEELELSSIGDLAPVAAERKIAGDFEFFERTDWRSIRDAYGLSFAEQVTFDSTFMYDAVRTGRVDVIAAFSSDGRIDRFDLVILEDPAGAIPPYDAVILLSPRVADRREVVDALAPLIGAIDLEMMRRINHSVDRAEDEISPESAAATLLQELGSGVSADGQ